MTMDIKEVLAPASTERIILVVLVWGLSSVGVSRYLDQSLLRIELVLSGILVFGWAVWAIDYRFEQAKKERYERQR
jgi:hypothetical protein